MPKQARTVRKEVMADSSQRYKSPAFAPIPNRPFSPPLSQFNQALRLVLGLSLVEKMTDEEVANKLIWRIRQQYKKE